MGDVEGFRGKVDAGPPVKPLAPRPIVP
jgi:hypothetical protein